MSSAAILLADAITLVRITARSVTRSARGLGVGRALVGAVERHARKRKMGAMIREVGSGRRPERAAAHRFCPAMGFVDANQTAARYVKRLHPTPRP